jgi:hypothetical protein
VAYSQDLLRLSLDWRNIGADHEPKNLIAANARLNVKGLRWSKLGVHGNNRRKGTRYDRVHCFRIAGTWLTGPHANDLPPSACAGAFLKFFFLVLP